MQNINRVSSIVTSLELLTYLFLGNKNLPKKVSNEVNLFKMTQTTKNRYCMSESHPFFEETIKSHEYNPIYILENLMIPNTRFLYLEYLSTNSLEEISTKFRELSNSDLLITSIENLPDDIIKSLSEAFHLSRHLIALIYLDSKNCYQIAKVIGNRWECSKNDDSRYIGFESFKGFSKLLVSFKKREHVLKALIYYKEKSDMIYIV